MIIKLQNKVCYDYEYLMNKLELNNLGVSDIDNYYSKNILINDIPDSAINNIIERSTFIDSINDIRTNYSKIISKNYRNNQNLYLTHWFYYYRGKFHPQFIRALLNIIGVKDGEYVLDPFSGSGTMGLESMLLGINCYCFDISPICTFVGNVKCNSVFHYDEILFLESHFSKETWSNNIDNFEYYACFIKDNTVNEYVNDFYLLVWLNTMKHQLSLKGSFYDIYRYYLRKMINSLNDYKYIIETLNLNLGNTEFITGDSRKMPISDDSIDGIVTSPPYFSALDYLKNDDSAYSILNVNIDNLRTNFIGLRGNNGDKLSMFTEDLQKVYEESYRVIKKDKVMVIIIGNNIFYGKRINNVKMSIDLMESVGFKLVMNIPKLIAGNKNKILKENILFFKK